MLISHERKFIFVHIQKTAGQSVTETLKQKVPDLEKLSSDRKHDFAKMGREKLGRDRWNEYYKFAFVRNPWERLVSWYSMILGICLDRDLSATYSKYDIRNNLVSAYKKYRYLHRPHPNQLYAYVLKNCNSFEEFIKNSDRDNQKNMINQLDYLVDDNQEIIVDFIGRFESLEEDFNKVTTVLQLPDVKLPHITHKSKHKQYQEYYNQEICEIVNKRFYKDINHFGYEF